MLIRIAAPYGDMATGRVPSAAASGWGGGLLYTLSRSGANPNLRWIAPVFLEDAIEQMNRPIQSLETS